MKSDNSLSLEKTWVRRLEKAKKKHRPRLKDWRKDRFASDRKNDFIALGNLNFLNNIEPCGNPKINGESNSNGIESLSYSHFVERIDSSDLSYEQFRLNYEEKELPCIISNIPALEGWRAVKSWRFERFNAYRDRYFKVGEDDDGYSVKIRLKYFLQYLQDNSDDSPLYVFDSHFDNDHISKSLLHDYTVPSYFSDDLFSLVGEKRRPPYRWFLIGPARSGTCVHIDPLGTSAWNTVIEGRKRWVLMPPNTPKKVAKALEVFRKGEDDEAINYFVDAIPRLKRLYPHLLVLEFIQYPGDTVFVPGGWWHAVLNLDNTIAITQNFCSRVNFPKVWCSTRKGRKKMAVRWLKELKLKYPHLANIALELNRQDNFEMYDKEKEREKSIRENREKKTEKRSHKRSNSTSDEDSSSSRQKKRQK